ncbi:hypothetical protein [Mangrovibacter phragmitis]|jgi:hypothetical protein|nr:hypothetical protein [Mangrovibacter phragmitis]
MQHEQTLANSATTPVAKPASLDDVFTQMLDELEAIVAEAQVRLAEELYA